MRNAVAGYIFEGEYCGDWELDPNTVLDDKLAHDFSKNVIHKWPPHTFIPDPLPLDCNLLYPDGHSV